jgi:hypothetical protein
MGKFYKAEVKTELFKVSVNVARLPSGSFLKIGGQAYEVGQLDLDMSTTGVGGLDTGTKQALSFYNVFVIIDSGNPALVASLSNAPTGYTSFNQIGRLRTNASSDIIGASTKDVGAVGDVKYSRLTEEQFVQENGIGWVLYDGSDISGRKLAGLIGANQLEDVRGRFLRAKNYDRVTGGNPDGDLNLGQEQEHALGSHRHPVRGTNFAGTTGTANYLGAINVSNSVNSTASLGTNLVGDNETRPSNTTMNLFIKVD